MTSPTLTGPGRYSLQFASRGANVVVNDFNPDAAQKVVDQIVKGKLNFARIRLVGS